MLTYGFNHDAAERSYLKATAPIPTARCAGEGSVGLGPHVNAAWAREP
jgi:hypothetical protein